MNKKTDNEGGNRILLIEPDHYSKYPPIGLLKISSYHKSLGDETELIRFKSGKKSHQSNLLEYEDEKLQLPKGEPSKIYITSLYTWTWESVWEATRFYKNKYPNVEVILGGIYASLMPDHAQLSGADTIYQGICQKVENMLPDYDLVPEWDGSIVFTSRGCYNNCGFCAVPKLEGKMNSIKNSIKPYVFDKHSKIVFFDNNFLANKYKMKIFDELIDYNKKVDFNQGIDARLITEPIADKIGQLRLDSTIRIAYDSKEQKKSVEKAVNFLLNAGVSKRKIFVYTLFNYLETPDDFFHRVRDLINMGVVSYPMRYEPLDTLKKNEYVSPYSWSKEKINTVQRARRVLGWGGSFIPHKGLVNKLNEATSFEEAFKLRDIKKE